MISYNVMLQVRVEYDQTVDADAVAKLVQECLEDYLTGGSVRSVAPAVDVSVTLLEG